LQNVFSVLRSGRIQPTAWQPSIIGGHYGLIKAIEYSLKHWDRLTLFADTDLLDPDKNRVENARRPVAVGRKNYLFADSHYAAQRSAMF
jgi:hypothetical protein